MVPLLEPPKKTTTNNEGTKWASPSIENVVQLVCAAHEIAADHQGRFELQPQIAL